MNPTPPRFTVSVVGEAVGQFERLAERAEQLDLREALVIAYRFITNTLKTRPREWGDPIHNYHGLNATGYKQAILSVGSWVEYAVHNTGPVVWISRLIVLPDSPFAGG